MVQRWGHRLHSRTRSTRRSRRLHGGPCPERSRVSAPGPIPISCLVGARIKFHASRTRSSAACRFWRRGAQARPSATSCGASRSRCRGSRSSIGLWHADRDSALLSTLRAEGGDEHVVLSIGELLAFCQALAVRERTSQTRRSMMRSRAPDPVASPVERRRRGGIAPTNRCPDTSPCFLRRRG